MIPVINIRSFDFDGCIFNSLYDQLKRDDRLIIANGNLLRITETEIKENAYAEVIFMVGSNRQSFPVDFNNAGDGRGSCFPALHQLCDFIQRHIAPITCRVDQYLLADTYGKTEAGIHYQKALIDDREFKHSHWLFDDSKFTVLYAQMHKAATDHPTAEVIFDFYDDRYNDDSDILNRLADVFKSHPDLMPHNLTLRLHHYEGRDITTIATIQGTGPLDCHYQEHIHLMIHHAGLSLQEDHFRKNNVLNRLIGSDGLAEFKQKRLVKIEHNDNTDTYCPYTTPPVLYQRPDSPRTRRFKQVYWLAEKRTPENLRLLFNTHFNIDLERNGTTPIQQHAAEGHHEAVEVLLQAGSSRLSAARGYRSAGFFSSEEKTAQTLNAIQDPALRAELLKANQDLAESPNQNAHSLSSPR